MCGINAYKLHQPLDRYRRMDDADNPMIQVVGITDLGGRVHEYEYGYRAQYGRLMEAVVISRVPYGSRFIDYLANKYEAPFRVQTWSEYKKEWEATHGRDWEAETQDQDSETGAEDETPASKGTYAGTGSFSFGTASRAATAIYGNVLTASEINAGVTLGEPQEADTVYAKRLGHRKWQPRLSDGRKLYKYLSLRPEFTSNPFLSHRPVTRRTKRAAIRYGTAIRDDKWWTKPFTRHLAFSLSCGAFVCGLLVSIGLVFG